MTTESPDLIDSPVLRALANPSQQKPLRIDLANAIYQRAFQQGRQAQDLEFSDLEAKLDPLDHGAAFGLAARAWEQGKAERCTILPFGPDKLAELQKQAVLEFLERHSAPDPFDDIPDDDDDGSPSPFAPDDEYAHRVLLERTARQSEDDLMEHEAALEEATRQHIRRIRKEVLSPEENARLKDDDILRLYPQIQEQEAQTTEAAQTTAQALVSAADAAQDLASGLQSVYESVPLVTEPAKEHAPAAEEHAAQPPAKPKRKKRKKSQQPPKDDTAATTDGLQAVIVRQSDTITQLNGQIKDLQDQMQKLTGEVQKLKPALGGLSSHTAQAVSLMSELAANTAAADQKLSAEIKSCKKAIDSIRRG